MDKGYKQRVEAAIRELKEKNPNLKIEDSGPVECIHKRDSLSEIIKTQEDADHLRMMIKKLQQEQKRRDQKQM